MKSSFWRIILFFATIFIVQQSLSQENTGIKKDSLRFLPDKPLPLQPNSAKANGFNINIPTRHPLLEQKGLQYKHFSDKRKAG